MRRLTTPILLVVVGSVPRVPSPPRHESAPEQLAIVCTLFASSAFLGMGGIWLVRDTEEYVRVPATTPFCSVATQFSSLSRRCGHSERDNAGIQSRPRGYRSPRGSSRRPRGVAVASATDRSVPDCLPHDVLGLGLSYVLFELVDEPSRPFRHQFSFRSGPSSLGWAWRIDFRNARRGEWSVLS